MEVIENESIDAEREIENYWHIFLKRSLTILSAVEVIVSIIIVSTLMLTNVIPATLFSFILILLVTTIWLVTVNVYLFKFLVKPFRDLVSAVVHVSSGTARAIPPNPNFYHYDKDGFKEILQSVYELSVKRTQPKKHITSLDEQLTQGLNHTTTGVIVLDKKRQVIYANNAAPTHIDSEGKRVLDLIFPDNSNLDTWLDKTESSLRSENQWSRVANKPLGDTDRRLYDVAASYQKNNAAETVITLFDRTDLYAPEEDDLDFISFAAHELRGPITVIRGYLDVLEDELSPVLKNDQAELMQRLIVSSNRLSTYVNNILNASRFDRRHFKVHLNEETLNTIYDSIKDDMQLRAASQNRLLTIDIPKSLPTVAADANSVGEVLSNLIDNAIKYSNEGGLVQVVARPISGFVEVSIIDRGIGMPSNVIQNLFHKFYRSHRSRETVAGTGIGLYICKAIVESHGGIVTARSAEREGSTFTFTLPIYDTVADKLKADNNSNEALIDQGSGWIRNHSMYRG